MSALQDVDLLVSPTTPFVAPRIDDSHLITVSRDINRFNAVWSLVRLPALSLPLVASGNLPVGGQLIARRGQDAWLLDVAEEMQQQTDWHLRVPPRAASAPHPGHLQTTVRP